MSFKIFHTINSGLLIGWRDTSVLVDVLHSKAEGFSDVPGLIREQIIGGVGPISEAGGLIFTHKHLDHYDADLIAEFCSRCPDIPLIAPDFCKDCCELLSQDSGIRRFKIGDLDIVMISTIHDGDMYRDVKHDSLLVGAGGEYILIAGDAGLSEAECERIAKVAQPTYGFFNVYQLSKLSVRKLIDNVSIRRVFLYHLGYAEDDKFQYRELAENVIEKFPSVLPKPELIEPMSWILNSRSCDQRT